MSIIRNLIDVTGITPDYKIRKLQNGQTIQYCETETIYIPEEHPEIKNIIQIMLQVRVLSNRTILVPDGKNIILDGVKEYKVIGLEKGEEGKVSVMNINLPYNTFIEVPASVESLGNIQVQVLDAYFDLLDTRRIYSHLLFLVKAPYELSEATIERSTSSHTNKNLLIQRKRKNRNTKKSTVPSIRILDP